MQIHTRNKINDLMENNFYKRKNILKNQFNPRNYTKGKKEKEQLEFLNQLNSS